MGFAPSYCDKRTGAVNNEPLMVRPSWFVTNGSPTGRPGWFTIDAAWNHQFTNRSSQTPVGRWSCSHWIGALEMDINQLPSMKTPLRPALEVHNLRLMIHIKNFVTRQYVTEFCYYAPQVPWPLQQYSPQSQRTVVVTRNLIPFWMILLSGPWFIIPYSD